MPKWIHLHLHQHSNGSLNHLPGNPGTKIEMPEQVLVSFCDLVHNHVDAVCVMNYCGVFTLQQPHRSAPTHPCSVSAADELSVPPTNSNCPLLTNSFTCSLFCGFCDSHHNLKNELHTTITNCSLLLLHFGPYEPLFWVCS